VGVDVVSPAGRVVTTPVEPAAPPPVKAGEPAFPVAPLDGDVVEGAADLPAVAGTTLAGAPAALAAGSGVPAASPLQAASVPNMRRIPRNSLVIVIFVLIVSLGCVPAFSTSRFLAVAFPRLSIDFLSVWSFDPIIRFSDFICRCVAVPSEP
jgi:hypothetical protein